MLFNDGDIRKVVELQREISIVLLKANDQKLEAGLAVLALVRCARILLDKYPEPVRIALAGVIAAFLRHDDVDGEEMRGLLR